MASESSKTDVRAEFKKLDKKSNLLRLAAMMKPYAGKMLMAAAFVVIVSVCELIKPLAAAVVIDDFVRGGKLRIYRDDIMICEGGVKQLKRFKDDVKEVAQGFECGIGLERFNDIKEGDILEAYIMEEVKPA